MSSHDFVLQVLATATTSTVLATVFGWVLNNIVLERYKASVKYEIDAKLEKYKNELKESVDAKLESHKASLKSEYDKQLESYKVDVAAIGRVAQHQWDIKREACLAALGIVDAFYSQTSNMKVTPVRQETTTLRAREVYNQLSLSCISDNVLRVFIAALPLRSEGDDVRTVSLSGINELRNAIREELGFGKKLALDDNKAWIARLFGHESPPVDPKVSGRDQATSISAL